MCQRRYREARHDTIEHLLFVLLTDHQLVQDAQSSWVWRWILMRGYVAREQRNGMMAHCCQTVWWAARDELRQTFKAGTECGSLHAGRRIG